MSYREPMVLNVKKWEPNVRVAGPSILRDVWAIVQVGILALLGYCIVVLVMA